MNEDQCGRDLPMPGPVWTAYCWIRIALILLRPVLVALLILALLGLGIFLIFITC